MTTMTYTTTGPSPVMPTAGVKRNPDSIYLYPGKLHVSVTPVTISTILGSCVAIGLWDQQAGIGGMNHFMLPWGAERSAKFANHSLPMLLSELEQLGARRNRLQACLLGGSVMAERDHFQLGPRNLEVAWRFIDEHSIPVVHQDCGGDRGRKVQFNTADGTLNLRRL